MAAPFPHPFDNRALTLSLAFLIGVNPAALYHLYTLWPNAQSEDAEEIKEQQQDNIQTHNTHDTLYAFHPSPSSDPSSSLVSSVFFPEALKAARAHDYHGAIQLWTDVIQYDNNNYTAYLNRALEYLMIGNYEAALGDADVSLVLKCDNNPRGHLHRGSVFMARQQYTTALEEFRKASFEADQLGNNELREFARKLIHLATEKLAEELIRGSSSAYKAAGHEQGNDERKGDFVSLASTRSSDELSIRQRTEPMLNHLFAAVLTPRTPQQDDTAHAEDTPADSNTQTAPATAPAPSSASSLTLSSPSSSVILVDRHVLCDSLTSLTTVDPAGFIHYELVPLEPLSPVALSGSTLSMFDSATLSDSVSGSEASSSIFISGGDGGSRNTKKPLFQESEDNEKSENGVDKQNGEEERTEI